MAQQSYPQVFHVYVDPIFGDNTQAFAHNPGGNATPTPPAPYALHPDNDPTQHPNDVPHGIIRHAPYSFRTLTGDFGVGAYLERIEASVSTGLVIIHCLPGLYGPNPAMPGSPAPLPDPNTGLVFNGEVWPFALKWFWSLQGTSALDTCFDARDQPTAIVVVQAESSQSLSHRESIIDSLTIRGARVNGGAMTPTNSSGAGVYISGQPKMAGPRGVQIGVTISNCFIVDNHVGVGIDNPPFAELAVSDPRIVNCTFARNWIGIWNGARGAGEENTGWARPILLNNIFDSWRPDVPATGTTPFVGIHPYDIAVGAWRHVNSSTVFTNLDPPRSYCAWESGRHNFPVALPGWPVPGVPPPFPAFPAPRVNIAPYTGLNPTTPRGALFINDLFDRAGIQAVPGVSYSPHDFRLAPSVSTSTLPPPPPPQGLNPLVNAGIHLNAHPPVTGTVAAIQIASTRYALPGAPSALSLPPGPPNREPQTTLHAWDFDCDGYGNPRAITRSDFAVGMDPDTEIDIGADEVHELIVAGYIDRTRILATQVPVAQFIGDHRRVFFVNVAMSNRQRPFFNLVDGKTYPWWPHVQGAPPDAALGSNYTAGHVPGQPLTRRAQLRIDFNKPLFMRNLECDISPHLISDPHALWPLGFPPLVGEVPDIYATNPWWWHDAPPPPTGTPFRYDTGALYHNVLGSPPWGAHGGQNVVVIPLGLPETTVQSGTINPPGTYLPMTWNPYVGLYLTVPVTPFLSISPCGSGAPFYTVDAWGLGDAGSGCPDVVPTLPDGRGLRVNFQAYTGGWRNLQTLLSAGTVPSTPVEPSMLGEPRQESVEHHSRLVRDRLRGR